MPAPDPSTYRLVRFLLARVDEDDDEARRMRRRLLRNHQADRDPERMSDTERQSAECLAKRAVIGDAQALLVLRDLPVEKPVRDAALRMLRAMALPYRDHRGYQAEWAPRSSRSTLVDHGAVEAWGDTVTTGEPHQVANGAVS